MGETMNVGQLVTLVSIFDRQGHADQSPDALLKEALSAVAACVPAARAVGVYRLRGNALHLWSRWSQTDANDVAHQPPIQLADAPAYDGLFQQAAPVIHQNTWIVPLAGDMQPLGTLEIDFEQPAPAIPDWLGIFSRQLSLALVNRLGQTLIRRQARASASLTGCATFREMAEVLGQNLLEGGEFISINVVRFTPDRALAGFEVIATANRHQSYETSEVVDLKLEEFGPLQALFQDEQSAPAMLDNLPGSDVSRAYIGQWLARFKIQSLCALPLRAYGQTVGFICINSIAGQLSLSPLQIQIYQTLADQMSSLIRLHRLFETTQYTQNLSERVAQAFNALTVGQDLMAMARIVGSHILLKSQHTLVVSRLIHDDEGQITGWQPLGTVTVEGAQQPAPDIPPAWQDVGADLRRAAADGEVLLIDQVGPNTQETVGERLYQWLRDAEVREFLSVPIKIEGRTVALLFVVNASGTAFIKEEVNALANVADQIGALLHVDHLLKQAEHARETVSALVMANRLIAAAPDYEHVTQALSATIANKMQAVGITLFDQPIRQEDEALSVARSLVALSTPDSALKAANGALTIFDTPPTPEHLSRLWDGQPLLMDIEHDHAGLPAESNIRWMATFGLRTGSQMLGTLDIMHHAPYNLSPEEINAYTNLADQVSVLIFSRQLLLESEQTRAFVDQLIEASREITRSETHVEVAAAALKAMPAVVDVLGIALLDRPILPDEMPESLTAEVIAFRDRILEPKIVDLIDPTDPRLAVTFKRQLEGEMFLMPDLSQYEPIIAANSIAFIHKHGIKSLGTLGLRSGSRLLGLLTFGSRHDLPTGGAALTNLRTLADQMALSIENQAIISENTRLLHDAQRQAQQLQHIATFSQSMQATLDTAAIFEIAMAESTKMIALDYMSVILYDSRRERLVAAAEYSNGTSKTPLYDGREVAQKDTPFGQVWTTRERLYLADLEREPTLKHPLKPGLRSDLITPILSRGLVLGMVEVACFAANAYNPTDIVVFQQMVNQLTTALENAETYSQSQKLAKNKTLVNEIATQLQQQTEMDSILNITLNELGKALGARRGHIRLGMQPNNSKQ